MNPRRIQPNIVQDIEAAVRRIIADTGIGVLLVEQHLHFVRQADRYYAMQQGGIVTSGPTRELSQSVVDQFPVSDPPEDQAQSDSLLVSSCFITYSLTSARRCNIWPDIDIFQISKRASAGASNQNISVGITTFSR